MQHIKDRILLSVRNLDSYAVRRAALCLIPVVYVLTLLPWQPERNALRPSLIGLASGIALMLQKWLTLDCLRELVRRYEVAENFQPSLA